MADDADDNDEQRFQQPKPRSLRVRLDELLQRPPQPGAAAAAAASGQRLRPSPLSQAGSVDGAVSAAPQAAPDFADQVVQADPPAAAGLADQGVRPGLQPVVYGRELPRRLVVSRPPDRASAGSPTLLATAVPGVETPGPRGGQAYLVRTSLARLVGGGGFGEAFADVWRRPDWPLRGWLTEHGFPATSGPEQVVFLDLETAGLGSAPLFLIGALVWSAQGLEAVQYLARDYAEEGPAIDLFLADSQHRGLLVTFNGKSFDYPFLRARAAATGAPFSWRPCHLDLLHASRRVWGGVLPDCRLQTLERFVCRRARTADISGERIPEAYHAFVRTSDAAEMVDVIRHNLLDLATLAELMTRFPPV